MYLSAAPLLSLVRKLWLIFEKSVNEIHDLKYYYYNYFCNVSFLCNDLYTYYIKTNKAPKQMCLAYITIVVQNFNILTRICIEKLNISNNYFYMILNPKMYQFELIYFPCVHFWIPMNEYVMHNSLLNNIKTNVV